MSWLALGLVPNYGPSGDPPDSFDLGGQVQLVRIPEELWECATRAPGLTEEQLQWLVPRSSHALVFRYQLAVDPGRIFTLAQRQISDRLMSGNLAVWLVNMSTDLYYRYTVHLRLGEGGAELRQFRAAEPLYTGRYSEPTTLAHLHEARVVNEVMLSLKREGPLWTAIRALWGALVQTWFHGRYALLWTGLEALFGPQDGDAVVFRVSQNLSFFLAANADDRRRLFRDAKKAYRARSKVVHGEHQGVREDDFDSLVHEAETWLREAILRILRSPAYLEAFLTSERRDALMERLVLGEEV